MVSYASRECLNRKMSQYNQSDMQDLHCCIAARGNSFRTCETYLKGQQGRSKPTHRIMRQAMTVTNEKAVTDDTALYHAARRARTKAFVAAIGKAAIGIKNLVNRGVVAPLLARQQRRRQLEWLL